MSKKADCEQGVNNYATDSGMHLLTLSYSVLAEGCAKAAGRADGLAVVAE
jgi:hypothetical protein